MRIEYVGNITTQPLGRIKQSFATDSIEVVHHNIDQVMQVLLGASTADALIAHVTSEYFLRDGTANALTQMQHYCQAVEAFAKRNHTVVVLNTLPLPVHRIVGVAHIARQRLLMELNEALFQCAQSCAWVSIADTAAVLARIGHNTAISAVNNAVMRMPYTAPAIQGLLAEYTRVLKERFQPRIKVLILDADNTLWGGVVGEDGVSGIQIGDQYPGIVFRNFQAALLEVKDSGVLLCLVTKNNEQDVKEAFDHLDMPLRWNDFAAIRANWNSKSGNIESIAKQLNIGLDAMFFIDDNPIEIAEVSARLPTVGSRQFQVREAANALAWLSEVPALSIWSPSDEDLSKSLQYQQEAARHQLAASTPSLEAYIQSLEMVIEVGINRCAHVQRIAQLTNKTNQFNLTTRRYTEANILSAMDEGLVFDFRVRDRFGDMGIVAVVVVRNQTIEAFLMSCRTMGRRVEEDILQYVLKHIKQRPLKARYLPTPKNPMVADFYDRQGFYLIAQEQGERTYEYSRNNHGEFFNQIIEVY